MMDFDFYWGAASGSAQKALRKLEEPNVMLNYATKNNRPWDGIERLFIDSGGYSFMLNKGEYTTSNADYLDYIEEHQPERFALRDYACEPDVLEKRGRTVAEHQRMTTNRHIDLLDAIEDRGIESTPVSCLQGWDYEEYLEHMDTLADQGALCDHVAVGSVCRRHAESTIRSILRSVRVALPARCSLHAFGVKTSILEYPEARRDIDSADSIAYDYSQRQDSLHNGDGTRTWQDIARYYLNMKDRIDKLRGEVTAGDSRQTMLAEVGHAE